MVAAGACADRRRLKLMVRTSAGAGRRTARRQCRCPPPGPVWIHGASVGEVLVRGRSSDCALNLHLADAGDRDLGGDRGERFPARRHPSIRPARPAAPASRGFDHWRPSLALFIESDLWANLILASATRRLPMVLINGRMSHRRFRAGDALEHHPGAARPAPTPICAPGRRSAAPGSRNVALTGNLKLDLALPADPAKLERLMAVTRLPDRGGGLHSIQVRKSRWCGRTGARRLLSIAAHGDRAAHVDRGVFSSRAWSRPRALHGVALA